MLPAINTAFSNAAAVDATPWIFATPFSTVTDKFSTPGLSSAMCCVTALDASSSLEKTFLPMSLTKSNKPILKFLLYVCLREYYDTEIPLRSL